jgi:hypothetical protein
MIRGRGEIVESADLCVDVLMKVQARHGGEESPTLREVLRGQAAKRVVLRIHPEKTASWDHAKLGGMY